MQHKAVLKRWPRFLDRIFECILMIDKAAVDFFSKVINLYPNK